MNALRPKHMLSHFATGWIGRVVADGRVSLRRVRAQVPS